MAASLLFGPLLAAVLAAAPAPADSAPVVAAPLVFRRTVFATAKDIPSPVAFSIDEHGRIWTANSQRYDGHGLFDNRAFPIVPEDQRSHSVEERRRITEGWVRAGRFDSRAQKVTLDWLAGFSEQVRRLEDTRGTGRADKVTIVADGMNELERGAAAGVLAWDDRVFATIIPDLFVLRDSAGTGHWTRTSLQDGFGVHMGQGGHDMHGLTIGNDGRLYWSIADRGYHFTTREGLALDGHCGAVFRCWPDGSGIESWATGLRNPQELAFNDEGDLFTGDNNADVGDRARLMYLPEGANGGWEYYLQHMPGCGAWTRERMWEQRGEPRDASQPAWVATASGYVATCPSGLAAYPGTGLPARYDGTLWLVDYLSGVQSFRPVARGAGFGMEDWHWGFQDSWGMCDFDFGYDGRLWVLYWGESWHQNEKARLVSLTPPTEGVDTLAVSEVRRLFDAGFRGLADSTLTRLLAHRDRRVRQRSSFELARRGRVDALARVLVTSPPLARMHALWALGIAGHVSGSAAVVRSVSGALRDADPEVRRVALAILADLGASASGPQVVAALSDTAPRVRFAAAQAIARLRVTGAEDALTTRLAENDDRDDVLRFALARALAATSTPARLAALAADPRRAVRLGVVLALRERRAEEVSRFLADADPQVATEAARAAYDLELPGAMAALAATLPGLRADLRTEPYVRRAVHAALRSGGAAQADQVARFAAEPATSETWRIVALGALAGWDRPDSNDGVWGRWEPLPSRPKGLAHEALARELPAILAASRGADLGPAIDLARREGATVGNDVLLAWAVDENVDDYARAFALRWLAARGAPEVNTAVRAALGSSSDSLFAAGMGLVLAGDPTRAVSGGEDIWAAEGTPVQVRQTLVRVIGRSGSPAAAAFLSRRLAELGSGKLSPAIRLDVLEAAGSSPAGTVRAAARAISARANPRDPLAPWLALLQGGDPARGREVFERHPTMACVRCHKLNGSGGTAGPDLSVIGTHTRRYLLQSLVDPSAVIAPGYGTTALSLRGDSSVTGILRRETADSVYVLVDGAMQSVPRNAILERTSVGSAMPPMSGVLQPGQLRDLVALMAAQRDTLPDVSLGVPIALDGVPPRTDTSCEGRPLRVAGRVFAHGLGVHAVSRMVYAVPPGAGVFVAKAGVDDEAEGGLVTFSVRVDGRPAWGSPPMKHGRIAYAFVSLPQGARRIELLVGDGGNGIASDDADWVEAGFLR